MARPALKLLKAYAKSLDEKTRVQFYLDILAGEVDFSKYSPDQPREANGQWGDGGGSSTTTDYRMQHQAPTRGDSDYGAPATNVEEVMPDFYKHPEYYKTGMDEADKQSIAALMAIKNNPDAKVTIYRAVPGNVSQINQGDWITLSHSYAVGHTGYLENENGHVISQTVSAKDLWFDGNSVNEFGYDPVVAKALFAKYLAKAFDPSQERDDHGRWTSGGTGNFTSAQLEAHQEKYGETYGQDKYGLFAGVSADQFRAIKEYSKNGYLQINPYLRTGAPVLPDSGAYPSGDIYSAVYSKIGDSFSGEGETPQSLTNAIDEAGGMNDEGTNVGDIARSFMESNPKEAVQMYVEYQAAQLDPQISNLDSLIATAPSMGDANLYRIVSDKVLSGLSPGDVMTDKGYTSTTSKDLTVQENLGARNDLANISTSSDTVAVILPNPAGENRALGVQQLFMATISSTTLSENEQEVLLPRATALQFIGYKDNVGTQARVAMFQRTN